MGQSRSFTRETEGSMSMTTTVSLILEEIKTEMCEKYCKYPYNWDEEVMGYELCESEVCANCPLSRL